MKNTSRKNIFNEYLFLLTSISLISESASPPNYKKKKKLKMKSVIFHQYISKRKDKRLVEVKIIILNVIQKLGYIFPLKFWSWIPLTAVIYDNFSVFLAFWGYFWTGNSTSKVCSSIMDVNVFFILKLQNIPHKHNLLFKLLKL